MPKYKILGNEVAVGWVCLLFLHAVISMFFSETDHGNGSKSLPWSWQDVGMASMILHSHAELLKFFHAKLSLHDSLVNLLTYYDPSLPNLSRIMHLDKTTILFWMHFCWRANSGSVEQLLVI